jgi:hypothetical protein
MDTSNNKGEFTTNLTSSIPTTGSNDLNKLLIQAPGYESLEIIPYKGDGTAKNDLGIIKLNPLNKGLEQDKINASQLTKDQIDELSKDKKDFNYFAQEKLTNQISNLKTILIPTVLTLVAGFGITKATDLAGKNKDKILEELKKKISCPSQGNILDVIDKKNKLVKQLNNTLKVIDVTTKALGITGGIIQGLEIALKLQLANPVPVPANITKIIDTLDKRLSSLKKINVGILSILVLLRQVLTQVLQLLNLLDLLIQSCYPNDNQEQLAIDLTNLTTQQSTEVPVVTNVNGFEMKVETENTNNSLKRRRATAQNKQGVIMLKGEWSFSSIDQILIDELVFYIQQNNLKAD